MSISVSIPDSLLEKSYLEKGRDFVVGIDEVGRGCWAGPVVVCAFVFTSSTQIIEGVKDSKLVTKKGREKLVVKLQKEKYSIGISDVHEIDELNIVNATALAMKRAVEKLSLTNFTAVIDGYFKDEFPFSSRCIVGGDKKHYSIAAASIIAKVYRDNLMSKLSKKYAGYGFENHVGYGTKEHQSALEQFGICEIHRKSYKPVKKYLNMANGKTQMSKRIE